MMGTDMCVPCEGGLVNLRVGAIIMKDGQSLMVGNKRSPEYLYSVGGRIQFGETAEEAVRREVREETGVDMEVDRLGFVHENYFYGDAPRQHGEADLRDILLFLHEGPPDFAPICGSFTEDGQKEFLHWVPIDTPVPYYPGFFRTELLAPSREVKYFLNDERQRPDFSGNGR